MNFNGNPFEFPFTPYETAEQTFWRLSQETYFFNIDFARRAHMMQLIAMLPDAFIGGCAEWMIKLITSGDTNMTPCRRVPALQRHHQLEQLHLPGMFMQLSLHRY